MFHKNASIAQILSESAEMRTKGPLYNSKKLVGWSFVNFLKLAHIRNFEPHKSAVTAIIVIQNGKFSKVHPTSCSEL